MTHEVIWGYLGVKVKFIISPYVMLSESNCKTNTPVKPGVTKVVISKW